MLDIGSNFFFFFFVSLLDEIATGINLFEDLILGSFVFCRP